MAGPLGGRARPPYRNVTYRNVTGVLCLFGIRRFSVVKPLNTRAGLNKFIAVAGSVPVRCMTFNPTGSRHLKPGN